MDDALASGLEQELSSSEMGESAPKKVTTSCYDRLVMNR